MAAGGEHGRKGFDVRKECFTGQLVCIYCWQAIGWMSLGTGNGHGNIKRRRCGLVRVEVLLLPLPLCPGNGKQLEVLGKFFFGSEERVPSVLVPGFYLSLGEVQELGHASAISNRQVLLCPESPFEERQLGVRERRAPATRFLGGA